MSAAPNPLVKPARSVVVTMVQVICPGCRYRYEQLDMSKQDFMALLRTDGWRDTKLYGWVCPECYELYVAPNARKPRKKAGQ